jgi:DivIVA domain-containing protein
MFLPRPDEAGARAFVEAPPLGQATNWGNRMYLGQHVDREIGAVLAMDEWLEGMEDPQTADDWPERDDREGSGSLAASAAIPLKVRGLPSEITPQELRNIEIRESFRGYHRGQVDSFCERAAETIERLQRQRSVLEERVGGGLDLQSGSVRLVNPAAKTALRPESEMARDADVIQRTLILAQRAADEAVTEAEARARALTRDAETKARALVTEAESAARRLADGERRRVEAEVIELGAAREALLADLDLLQRFAADYRERIREVIEAELERLGVAALADVQPPPAPELHEERATFAVLEPGPGSAELSDSCASGADCPA